MLDIYESIGYLLNTSARLVKRNLDLKLNAYEITTAQWAILKLLSNKESLTQAQITENLKSDRATCGAVIERLSNKKLVNKVTNKIDRRACDISISQEGRELVELLTTFAVQSNEQALSGLSDSEVENLYKSLNHIIENLEG